MIETKSNKYIINTNDSTILYLASRVIGLKTTSFVPVKTAEYRHKILLNKPELHLIIPNSSIAFL